MWLKVITTPQQEHRCHQLNAFLNKPNCYRLLGPNFDLTDI